MAKKSDPPTAPRPMKTCPPCRGGGKCCGGQKGCPTCGGTNQCYACGGGGKITA